MPEKKTKKKKKKKEKKKQTYWVRKGEGKSHD